MIADWFVQRANKFCCDITKISDEIKDENR